MKVRSLVQELTGVLLFAFGCGVGERNLVGEFGLAERVL